MDVEATVVLQHVVPYAMLAMPVSATMVKINGILKVDINFNLF